MTATCEYCGQAVLVPDGSRAGLKIDGNGELEISRSKRRKISNATHVK